MPDLLYNYVNEGSDEGVSRSRTPRVRRKVSMSRSCYVVSRSRSDCSTPKGRSEKKHNARRSLNRSCDRNPSESQDRNRRGAGSRGTLAASSSRRPRSRSRGRGDADRESVTEVPVVAVSSSSRALSDDPTEADLREFRRS